MALILPWWFGLHFWAGDTGWELPIAAQSGTAVAVVCRLCVFRNAEMRPSMTTNTEIRFCPCGNRDNRN